MPILNIEIVGPMEDGLRTGLAERLADLAAQALDSRPQGTWVTLNFVPSAHYAENAGGPPPGVWPVMVRVLQAVVPQGAALEKQASDLANAIATAVGRSSEQVHILVEPPAKGRIFFGGQAS